MGISLTNIRHINIGSSGSSYWKQRFPSGLILTIDSASQVTLTHTNNGTQDYDEIIYERSLDGFTFMELTTAVPGITSKSDTGLTTEVFYYYRIRYRKGDKYSSYSNIVGGVPYIIKMGDAFAGTTINTDKWTETDPNSRISQNESIILTANHSVDIAEFVNTLQSIQSISSGVAVAQGYLTWTTNSSQCAIGGIYLYKDVNNYASITSRATTLGNVMRIRIKTGGTTRYDLNVASTVAKAQNVKIWTDGTNIKFYYYDNVTTFAWIEIDSSTAKQYSLGYALKYLMTFQDATTFTGANPITIDNAYLTNKDYSTQFPEYQVIKKLTSYCWFTRNKAVYNNVAGLTWIGQNHDDGSGYTQHIMTVNNETGVVSTSKVGTVTANDDHNEPSILVRASDNKLFICYSGHSADNLIRYRISTNALDGTAWGNEQTKDVGGGANATVTYCSCFQASNGDIFIFYRETVNGWAYVKSTDGGTNFGNKVLFYYGGANNSGVAGTGRGYMTFAQSPVDADIIHFVATDGHPTSTAHTVSIFAIYFDCSDETVRKLDGTDVTAHTPLNDPSYMTSIMTNVLPNTGWVEDLIVDSSGNPRYLLTYFPDGKDTDYLTKELWYAEWNGSAVTTPVKIHTALVGYIGVNDIYIGGYPPNSCFDKNNPNVIIASKQVDGICEIHRIIKLSSGSFLSIAITHNHLDDQWRPFTVKATKRNLYYLYKIAYPAYTNPTEYLLTRTI
jgi:hypothetical protein